MMERLRGRAGCEQRERIRCRDCGLCQRCKAHGLITRGSIVDHKQALKNGGTNDDDNLWLICRECDRVKYRQDMGFKAIGCDASGIPTDAAHHWNAA